MAAETKIAWTDHTFNPWMGCNKVSSGCTNCYAEALTKNRMGLRLWGPPDKTKRQVTQSPWQNVKKWNRDALDAGENRLVFCGSLCDWAEDHPTANAIRPRLWDIIRECSNLQFQLLTKRPERIAKCLPNDWGQGYANVWLGTSIEDIRVANRADHLRKVAARIRFISYEPALGPLSGINLAGISWCIYGGESGPGYRAEDKQWARDMRDACASSGVAFFHKQSAGYRTEMGIELDGEIVRQYPDGYQRAEAESAEA